MKKQFKYPITAILLLIFCSNAWAQAPNIVYNPAFYNFTVGANAGNITPVNSGGSVPSTSSYAQVTTFAGSTAGAAGTTNGTGTAAKFRGPLGGVFDAAGNLYIADGDNSLIRKITPAGVVTTLVNTGSFSDPEGIAIDASGTLYVSDFTGKTIKKVNATTGAVTNWVTTAAGLKGPAGICFDNSGNLMVADQNANQIKLVNSAGAVSIYAGSGTAGQTNSTNKLTARFNQPIDVQVDASGNIFVADYYSGLVREISSAGVTNFGSGYQGPTGLAMDALGNLYVADYDGDGIWLVTPTGTATVIAGGNSGTTDGIGTAARFNSPIDLCFDANGVL